MEAGVEVFGGSQEPPEGHDDEVNDMGVEDPVFGVGSVESFRERSEDGDVGGVGSGAGIVVVFHGLEERSE